jgi:GDSL-like lipase/acylhydrolase family protein
LRKIERYIALGDSMSIDDYPRLDAASDLEGLGAASLLWRNADEHFPGWAGRDLCSQLDCAPPMAEPQVFAVDGATTESLLQDQLSRVTGSEEPTLVSVTIGGNDLLHCLAADEQTATDIMAAAGRRLDEIVERLTRRLGPNCLLLLNTVYDPTDGTGELQAGELRLNIKPKLALLDRWNQGMWDIARAVGRGVRVVDVHQHFLGHGITALDGSADFWYWPPSHIEPGLQGAHELRRLWWDAIQ